MKGKQLDDRKKIISAPEVKPLLLCRPKNRVEKRCFFHFSKGVRMEFFKFPWHFKDTQVEEVRSKNGSTNPKRAK